MKRTISIILCAVLCLGFLVACGGNDQPSAPPAATGTPDPGDSIGSTVGATADVGKDVKYKESLTVICDNTAMLVLDPAHAQATGQGSVMTLNCYLDRLIAYENDAFVPKLATDWTVEGNQHYTFRLRDDVYFHNGEKFTADDVAYSIERAKESAGSPAFIRWNTVESVDIINDYEIKLSLTSPNSDFLYYLPSPVCSILNREACESDAEKGTWIGTGPWILEDFASNESSQLRVNEDYWGEIPVTKKMRFVKVAEESTRYIMLQNDEVDVAFGCSPADFDDISASAALQLHTYTVTNMGFIGFNMTDPLMQDINFRKAVACLIDRAGVIDATRFGYGAVTPNGAYWGYDTPYRNMDLKLQDYDVELAKQYLAESNYNGEPVEVAAWLGEWKTIGQILQAELVNIGVNATFFETDQAGYAEHTNYFDNKSQIVASTSPWSPYASSCRAYFTEGASSNKSSIAIPEVVELLDTALATTDEAEREECYKKVQQIIYDEYIYIPVFSIRHGVGAAKDVGGIALNSENTHNLAYMFRIVE